MTLIKVYDPAMCCSTGVCGPEVDPKLAQFTGDLDWLKSQGIEVRRFNLAQEPASFVENPAIKTLLERSGGDELPAIVMNDQIVSSGRYPGRDELATLAGVKAARVYVELKVGAEQPAKPSSGCCGGASTQDVKTKTGCC